MSTSENVTRKKRNSDAVKRTSEDDHRRKRRNRTTQSCLNCHTSKRMCDRKRPCGRCTQLGLTGLCVYEVDDPNQRSDTSDEKGRLQKRVAELESVIRELKNKPHPRWAQTSASESGDKASSDAKLRISTSNSHSDDSGSSSPSSPSVQLQYPLSSRASPLNTMLSASSSSSAFSSPSPLDTPSPLTLTPVDIAGDHHSLAHGYDFASLLSSCYPDGTGLEGALDSIFDGLIRTDGLGSTSDSCLMRHDHPDGHCGCLNDTSSYNVVLELSLRLRRAAEILGNYSKHQTPSSCPIHQRIADLDRYTTEALANINTTTHNFPSYTSHSHGLSTPASTLSSSLHGPGSAVTRPPTLTTSTTVSPQSLHSSMRPWDYKASTAYPSPPCEDTFMSWEAHRRSAEQWSPSANL